VQTITAPQLGNGLFALDRLQGDLALNSAE
jgi:hypothetical protein